MKPFKNLVAALSACIILAGCASTPKDANGEKLSKKDINGRYLAALDSGKYKDGLSVLSKSKIKNQKIKDDFEKAMLLHYMKNYKDSYEILNVTDREMDDSITKSISQGIGAAIVNDNVKDYEATPYEYIYINIFNCLNYYNLGNIEEAAVEIRRMNEKQRVSLVKYGELAISAEDFNSDKGVKDAYSAFNISRSEITSHEPRKPTEDDIFKDSALARYMSLLFYMMENDKGNAELDARTLAVLNSSFDAKSELEIARGKGRLDVIAFTDLIGRRREERIVIGPFPNIMFPVRGILVDIPEFDIEFTYPKFDFVEKSPITAIKITVNGETKFLPLLEDFNYAVQKDVNSKAHKAYGRSVTRSLTKKLAAVSTGAASIAAAQIAADNSDSVIAATIARASALAAIVALPAAIEAIDKGENADIRQVWALPAKAYAGGFELAPGEYNVKVEYFAGDSLLETQNFEKVKVRAGKPSIVESLKLK